MIITCPSCATKFDVPDAALGSTGRKVKCVRCAHVWHQNPQMPEEAASPIVEDLPLMKQENLSAHYQSKKPQKEEKPKKPRKKRTKWLLLFGFLFSSIIALYFARDHIVTLYPPAAQIYDWIDAHIAFPEPDLVIENLDVRMTVIEETQILYVTGEVVNFSEQTLTLPSFQINLLNTENEVVQGQGFVIPRVEELPPQGRASFEISFVDPNPQASRFHIFSVDQGRVLQENQIMPENTAEGEMEVEEISPTLAP